MYDIQTSFIPEGEFAPDIGPGKRPLGPRRFMVM